MIPIPGEVSLPGEFDVTQEDLNRVAGQLERLAAPQDLKAIALHLLQERLEQGHPVSPAAPVDATCEDLIRLWDPAAEWQVGDILLLAHDRFGNSKYELFLGEITQAGFGSLEVKIDELQIIKIIPWTHPGAENVPADSPDSFALHRLLSEMIEKKLRAQDSKERAEGILLWHGERILNRLAASLRKDPRFIGLEGKWVLYQKLPQIEKESLQEIHRYLLQNPGASLDDLVPVVPNRPTTGVFLLKMIIQSALLASPDRFQNIGTAARPRWNALLPAHDQACVTNIAFDPQTFEILCCPGQRLSQKKVKRLQELDLYAHVVTFPEWNQPARHP